ncbi:hypothetical protein [Geomicrobium sediminis]|uniref:Uncharacterized protein n=1 Tax=Geomicrobium sediminis TaxID=1347788 RepID=A0ABS2PF94_9BACL|nr:hypothetical protein [Geomicrobium sediminis]MBM7634089.1 hypothetical protein [Geomicrobium sediminis]
MPRRITPHQTNEEFETKIGSQNRANRSKREAIEEANEYSDGRLDAHMQNDEIHHSHTNMEALDLIERDRFNNLLFDGERYATQSSYRDLMREIANINLHLEAEDRVINGATIGDTFSGSGSVDDGGIGISYISGVDSGISRDERGLFALSTQMSPAIRRTSINNNGNIPIIEDFENSNEVIRRDVDYAITEGHQRFLKVGNKYFYVISTTVNVERRHIIYISEDDCETWREHAVLEHGSNFRTSRFCAMDTDGSRLFIVYTSASTSSGNADNTSDLRFCTISIETGNVSNNRSIRGINRTGAVWSVAYTHLRPTIHYNEVRDEIHIACVINYAEDINNHGDQHEGKLRHWVCSATNFELDNWSSYFVATPSETSIATDAFITSELDGVPMLFSMVLWGNRGLRVHRNRFENGSWGNVNFGYGTNLYLGNEIDALISMSYGDLRNYALDYPLFFDVYRVVDGNHYVAHDCLSNTNTTVEPIKKFVEVKRITTNAASRIASANNDTNASISRNPKIFVDTNGSVAYVLTEHFVAGHATYRLRNTSIGASLPSELLGTNDTDTRFELQIVRTRNHDIFAEVTSGVTSNIPPLIWAKRDSDRELTFYFTGFWRNIDNFEEGEGISQTAKYRLEYDTDEVVLWMQATDSVDDIEVYLEGVEMDKSYTINSNGREFQFTKQVSEVLSSAEIQVVFFAKSGGSSTVHVLTKLIGGVSNA